MENEKDRRMEMQFLLEEISELEKKVRVGKEAEKNLEVREKHFKELCKAELEEVK